MVHNNNLNIRSDGLSDLFRMLSGGRNRQTETGEKTQKDGIG